MSKINRVPVKSKTEVFTWSLVSADQQDRPTCVYESNCGLNPCHLVGSKVFVLGMLGREGIHGMTIGICDLQTFEWEWVLDTSKDSPYLNSHTCFLADDCLYAHGGFRDGRADSLSSDIFQLDLCSLEWTRIHTLGDQPSARVWHSGGFVEHSREYVVYGGYSAGGNMKKDVWAYNVDYKAWAAPRVKGMAPTARYGLASCTIGKQVVFFGGRQIKSYFGDLHILDCSQQVFRWSGLLWQSSVLRCFSSLLHIDGRLIVFGGYDRRDVHHSVYAFEPPHFELRPVIGGAGSQISLEGVVPQAMYGHTAIKFRDEMYVFDGFDSDFNPKKLSFRQN